MPERRANAKEMTMRDFERDAATTEQELRWFVDDYCGCGPVDATDPVSEACTDAALMLAQRTAG
jgi:DNA-directed RNA polymerase specialized sigma24 family protein